MKSLAFLLLLLCITTTVLCAPSFEQKDASDVNWIVEFVERVYDPITDTTTFKYKVTVLNDQTCRTQGRDVCKDLSHWGLALCPALVQKFQSASPSQGVSLGNDPTTGIYGIKWDRQQNKGTTEFYTVTFKGLVLSGITQYEVKGGQYYILEDITGPSCETVPPTCPTVPSACADKLKLTAVCTSYERNTVRFKITNENNVALTVTYKVVHTGVETNVLVPANSEVYIEVPRNPNGATQVILSYNGVQAAIKTGNTDTCPDDKLDLTAICTLYNSNLARFRIRNEYSQPLTVSYEVVHTGVTQTVTVPANSDIFIDVPRNPNGPTTVILRYLGFQVDIKSSNPATCPEEKIALVAVCTDVVANLARFTIKNNNNVAVTVLYVNVHTGVSTQVTIPANSEVTINVPVNPNGPTRVQLLYQGQQIALVTSNTTPCEGNEPECPTNPCPGQCALQAGTQCCNDYTAGLQCYKPSEYICISFTNANNCPSQRLCRPNSGVCGPNYNCYDKCTHKCVNGVLVSLTPSEIPATCQTGNEPECPTNPNQPQCPGSCTAQGLPCCQDVYVGAQCYYPNIHTCVQVDNCTQRLCDYGCHVCGPNNQCYNPCTHKCVNGALVGLTPAEIPASCQTGNEPGCPAPNPSQPQCTSGVCALQNLLCCQDVFVGAQCFSPLTHTCVQVDNCTQRLCDPGCLTCGASHICYNPCTHKCVGGYLQGLLQSEIPASCQTGNEPDCPTGCAGNTVCAEQGYSCCNDIYNGPMCFSSAAHSCVRIGTTCNYRLCDPGCLVCGNQNICYNPTTHRCVNGALQGL